MDPHSHPALWRPPHLMRGYRRAKLVGAAVFTGIFAGLLYVQWSSPAMRYLFLALVLITLWVTVSSIISDNRREIGRQVALNHEAITLTTPTSTTRVALADIARAQWKDPPAPDAGLSLFAADGRVLAVLDPAFLADQSEARAFLGWARRHATLPFEVHWPAAGL